MNNKVAVRATKKQQQLLEFVDSFIKEHSYGPSYREIMNALEYKSVSTVAVHVEGLITKGFLRRSDNSARSLEVVGRTSESTAKKSNAIENELIKKATELIADKEDTSKKHQATILLESLEILGYTSKVEELRNLLED